MARSPLGRGVQEGARHLLESDSAREVLSVAVGEAIRSARQGGRGARTRTASSDGALSGFKGIAVGAGIAALAPVTARGLGRLIRGAQLVRAPKQAIEAVTAKVGSGAGAIGDTLGSAAGAGRRLGSLKRALPGGARGQRRASGHGSGRRMPVQQSVDVAAPVQTVYDHWTRFETWPQFMHRVINVSQEDRGTVRFATRIWGKTKEFTAKIDTQRPDERVKWHVTEGVVHTGVVTFHELGPRLTRVQLSLDVEPGSLLEKAARGMRHVKRAARGDLHRFKAYVEMQGEQDPGGWRGTIEDGKVASQPKRRAASASRSGAGRRTGSSGGASASRHGTRRRSAKWSPRG